MLALHELQTVFRRALVGEDARAHDTLRDLIADGKPTANERIEVYRNNVFASLTDALKETFPAVCRLVDERFFSYAAHEFISAHPPVRPSLSEYGNAFPNFLADFPPCRELVYLADVARFEWLMNVAAHAADAEPASPDSLAGIAQEDAARLTFGLHASYGYLASLFPADRIWRANRPGACGEAIIDLALGGVQLEVCRHDGDVVFRALDESTFAFRQALAGSSSFAEALERAFAIRPEFAAGDALSALFAEGAVIAVNLPSPGMEHAP